MRSAPVGLSGNFMDLPGVAPAYNFVREQIDTWRGIPARISAAIAKAGQLTALAQQQGRPQVASVTGESLSGLTTLNNFYNSANDKLNKALDELKSLGFGIVPLILAAAVIAAAGAFYYVFRQTEYYERVLSDVEAGTLTGQQGSDILGGGDGDQTFTGEIGKAVGKIILVGALAGGAYLGYKAYRSRKRA
jgi:hypothetical protein